MITYIISLICLSFSFASVAASFQGVVKNSNKECFLEIFEISTNERGLLSAEIKVIFDDSHKNFTSTEIDFVVGQAEGREDLLTGMGSNQKDRINLNLTSIAPTLLPKSYNVRFWHINHFHSLQCLDLKEI